MFIKRLIATAAIGLFTVTAAQAVQTWAFSYSGAGVTASGTFTTAGQALTFEPVLSISGQRNGAAIIGLVPLGEDPDFFYDNEFSSVSPFLTDGGLVFDFAGSLPNVNLYFSGGEYLDLIIPDGITGIEVPVTFSVTAVPEPATVASMLAGMALLAAYTHRNRRA